MMMKNKRDHEKQAIQGIAKKSWVYNYGNIVCTSIFCIVIVACAFVFIIQSKNNEPEMKHVSVTLAGTDIPATTYCNNEMALEFQLLPPYNGDPFQLSIRVLDGANNEIKQDWIAIDDYSTEPSILSLSQYAVGDRINLLISIHPLRNPSSQQNTEHIIRISPVEILDSTTIHQFPQEFKNSFYDQKTEYWSHVMALVLFIIISLLAATSIKGYGDYHVLLALSPIMGIGLLIITVFTLLLAGILRNTTLFILLTLWIAGLSIVVYKRKQPFSTQERLWLKSFFCISLVCAFVLPLMNYMVLSYDSYCYWLYQRQIFYGGTMGALSPAYVVSLGFIVPMLHAYGDAFGVNLFFSIHNLLTIYFLVFLIFVCQRYLRLPIRLFRIAIAASCALGVMSCYFFIFNSNWLMTNHISTILFASSVLCAFIFTNEQKSVFWGIAIIANMLFAFSRIETMLFALVYLYYLLTIGKNDRNRIVAAILHASFTLLWLVAILINYGSVNSDFLTAERILFIISLCLALIIFMFLCTVQSRIRVLLHPKVPLYGSLLVMVGIGIVKMEKIMYNFSVVRDNLLGVTGYWGVTWIILLLFYVLSLGRKSYPKRFVICNQIAIYCFLTFSIFIFRNDSLRVGFGDSGNRMMLTIVPLLFIDTILQIF
jgi:hypothetical protein